MERSPLPGGHTAPVYRSGDSVLRTPGPWTPNVHALMRHLRERGVPYVPEPRGIDADGREVVEYVDGDCPVYPLPRWAWTDDALCQVATALRAIHDASPPPVRTGWRRPAIEPVEVVCHGDVAPYNSVWRDGVLVAFIDWDHAVPAPRGWDLGYAAYRFAGLHDPRNDDGCRSDGPEQHRRLALFCDTYGADAGETLRWALVRVEDLIANRSIHSDIYERDAAWLRTLPGRSSR